MGHSPKIDFLSILAAGNLALRDAAVASIILTNTDIERRETRRSRTPVKLLLPLARNLR
jgi:hypothetical protein